VGRIGLFAAIAPVLMRMPLERLGRLLDPATPPPAPGPEVARELAWVVDRVLEAGRPLLRSGCMVRGLTRYYVLRRAGVDVNLCFGIGLHDDSASGHCWLEAQDEPILERCDPRLLYTEMYRLPSRH
jgi:hypothetical protein